MRLVLYFYTKNVIVELSTENKMDQKLRPLSDIKELLLSRSGLRDDRYKIILADVEVVSGTKKRGYTLTADLKVVLVDDKAGHFELSSEPITFYSKGTLTLELPEFAMRLV